MLRTAGTQNRSLPTKGVSGLFTCPEMRGHWGSGAKVQTLPHWTDTDTSLDDIPARGPGVSSGEGECGPTAQPQGQAEPSFQARVRVSEDSGCECGVCTACVHSVLGVCARVWGIHTHARGSPVQECV